MPFVELPHSPHVPGVRPVRIHYRVVGRGRPVGFLHGGVRSTSLPTIDLLHTSHFHFLAVGGNRPFRRTYIAVSA